MGSFFNRSCNHPRRSKHHFSKISFPIDVAAYQWLTVSSMARMHTEDTIRSYSPNHLRIFLLDDAGRSFPRCSKILLSSETPSSTCCNQPSPKPSESQGLVLVNINSSSRKKGNSQFLAWGYETMILFTHHSSTTKPFILRSGYQSVPSN